MPRLCQHCPGYVTARGLIGRQLLNNIRRSNSLCCLMRRITPRRVADGAGNWTEERMREFDERSSGCARMKAAVT